MEKLGGLMRKLCTKEHRITSYIFSPNNITAAGSGVAVNWKLPRSKQPHDGYYNFLGQTLPTLPLVQTIKTIRHSETFLLITYSNP